MSTEGELFSIACKERDGEHTYTVRILHEFGRNFGHLSCERIRDLWAEIRRYDVLFSDRTEGKVEPFLTLMLDPRSVWMEVVREDGKAVGLLYLTDIIPYHDAQAHFTLWGGTGSPRAKEPVIRRAMEWVFDRYHLLRLSAEIPPYQSGVIRFARRLGFEQEGVRRNAFVDEGKPVSMMMFGILREDLGTNLGGNVWARP